jgi:hypothetical protein
VDLRAGLDDLEKRKFNRDSNSDPSVVQPVASRCTDYAILTPLLGVGGLNYMKARKFN